MTVQLSGASPPVRVASLVFVGQCFACAAAMVLGFLSPLP